MTQHDVARRTLITGASLAGIAVAAGAWGSHGLRTVLTADMLAVFETAVRYQMYHAFALLITGILALSAAGNGARRLHYASLAFLAGIILFSGSLYLLALTDTRWLGAVTPAGGVCFLAGWTLLARGCLNLHDSGGK